MAYDQLEGTLTRRISAIDRQLLDVMARLEASIDFPDEGYRFIAASEVRDCLSVATEAIVAILKDADRGRMIREGATVAIVGKPNVGKSSVFNMLVGHDRAIVAPGAGTTRDMVTEQVELAGMSVMLVDTAGAHEAYDPVEREGVARGRRARDAANLLLVVLDQSEPATPGDEDVLRETAGRTRIMVMNKADRPACWQPHVAEPVVSVAACDGTGAQALSGGEGLRDVAGISNVRHISLLEEAHKSLRDAMTAAASDAPEEFVAADVARARSALAEICGVGAGDDVLTTIFERFCIGK
jgi:tRNA modification GTPase